MGDRNASPSAFGWDFQANAAILLMIENIKQAEKIRVEGADEDIEITLHNKEKIYAQVKAVERPENYTHVVDKLAAALETLNLAAKNGNGKLFTYITNSPNPFNNQKIMNYFTGNTHLDFDELSSQAQKRVLDLLKEKNYDDLDVNKMDIRVIPFYGRDLKNRYKEILSSIDNLLAESSIDVVGVNREILRIWQRDFFQNATIPDTEISITKEKMMWPLIVLVVDRVAANDYKKDFDDDEVDEIENNYKMVINQQTLLYEFVTKVICDFIQAKLSVKKFINANWENYVETISMVRADDHTREILIKIILHRILTQRNNISNLKKEIGL